MRCHRTVVVLSLCLLALLIPGAAWAQGEGLSLRGLADRLEALQERVSVLEEQRVVGLTEEERCGLGIFQTLRDETVLAYKNAYGEWPRMDRVSMRFVEFDPDTETIAILYQEYFERRWVMETWLGCTFQESSDWWEE